jgi:hypothetical protein
VSFPSSKRSGAAPSSWCCSSAALGLGAALTAACFALGAVVYRCVERPFLVRKAALGR